MRVCAYAQARTFKNLPFYKTFHPVDGYTITCYNSGNKGEIIMYKCSAKASLVLDQMRSRCQEDTQTNNKWHGKSGNYMYIMGRENADGKATGVVHKIADDSTHKLCGSFKIMSDGIITRFTGMSKADWNNAMRNAEAEYKVKYEAEQTTQEPAPTKVAV
jgi:hypothetical protein